MDLKTLWRFGKPKDDIQVLRDAQERTREELIVLQEAVRAMTSRFDRESETQANRSGLLAEELSEVRSRSSAYLGRGVALAYLADQRPIFVRSLDIGPGFSLLNGGRYEEDNLDVLMSFVRSDTIFLDVGANVGIFSMYIGQRARRGRVYAFEPQPDVAKLLRKSAYANGLRADDPSSPGVYCYQIAASDQDGEVGFATADDDTGGAHIGAGGLTVEAARLDRVLGSAFRCDLIKIDVEGHELAALNGMAEVIARSDGIKILFENWGTGTEAQRSIEALLHGWGFDLFRVLPGAKLATLPTGDLDRFHGYVFAARPGDPDLENLDRARFRLYADQLFTRGNATLTGSCMEASGSSDDLLFHGPYWFLRRGSYRLAFDGEISGDITLTLAARGGYPLANVTLSSARHEADFVLERDAVRFECIGRVTAGQQASIRLRSMEIHRRG